MSGSHEKLRAAFLAFVMVTSVVGATVAFSGSVAAGDVKTDGSSDTPDNVRAGAVNQQGFIGGSPQTIALNETAANAISTQSGTVVLEIPRSSKIRFDIQNSTNGAAVSNATTGTNATVSNVRFDSNRKYKFDVSGLESDKIEKLEAVGVYFDVPADATQTDLNFKIGTISAGHTLNVETLNAETSATQIVAGANETGAGQIAIEASTSPSTGSTDDGTDLDATDFAAQGKNITVSIPAQKQAELDFDKSTVPSLDTTNTQGLGSGDVVTPVFVDSHAFTFQIKNENVVSGDEIEFDGIQYNVTGVSDDSNPATFTSSLNVSYTPVDATGSVEIQTASANIQSNVPTVQIGDGDTDNEILIGPGQTGAGAAGTGIGNIDGDLSSNSGIITIVDNDDGTSGEISANGDVVIEIPSGNGVTFDQSQYIEVEDTNTDGSAAPGVENGSNVQLTSNSITIPISSSSQNDEALLVGTPSGGPDNQAVSSLDFNVTTASSVQNLNFTVTTNGGSADIVQNTSGGSADGSIANLDVNAPTLNTNDDNKNPDDGDTDLVIETDSGDGESNLDGSNGNDIVLKSGVDNDLADGSNDFNTTVTIPGSSAVTFDQSNSAPSLSSDDLGAVDGNDQAVLVDGRTVNITLDKDEAINSGESITVTGLKYNVSGDGSSSAELSATVNQTDVSLTARNFINATTVTADQVQADADNTGGFGSTGAGETKDSPTIGNTVTASVKVTNSSDPNTADVRLDNSGEFGGATVNLAATSGASLNTTSVTTKEDGTADFNVTVGNNVSKTYNVTASLASNSSFNVTLQYTPSSGTATQLNVTKVKDAIAGGATGATPTNTGEAIYRVQILDSGGNIVTGTDVDVGSIVGGDAQVSTAYDNIDNSLTSTDDQTSSPFSSSANNALDDGSDHGDGDGRLNYDATKDDTQQGEFFIGLSDSTEESVSLEINPESGSISSDSASAEFYKVRNVNVTLNRTTTTTTATQPVQATATLGNGNGATVTVPNVSSSFAFSNSTVAAFAGSSNTNTDFAGQTTTTVTGQVQGTTDVESLMRNKQGAATLTVSDPTYGISGVSLTPSTVTENTSVEHNLQYTVDAASNDGNSDTHTITLPNTTEITSANLNNVTDANGQEISISSGASLADANGGTNNQLTFGIQPDSSFDTSAVDVDANITVDFPTVSQQTTGDVNISVSDSNAGTTNASTTITVEEEQPPTATVTFGGEDGLTVVNGSTSVNVASARFDGTEDFVIVVHRASPGDDGVVDGTSEINAKIGSSDVLSGNVSDVSVNLTKNLDEGGNTQLTENQTLIAMLHFANESRPGDVNFDNPITRDGTPVFDQADITISEETFVEPVPGTGAESPPQDTDGDGTFEDVNGDNQLNFDDVIDLAIVRFNSQDQLTSQQRNALDINGDGNIDFNDVIALAEDVFAENEE